MWNLKKIGMDLLVSNFIDEQTTQGQFCCLVGGVLAHGQSKEAVADPYQNMLLGWCGFTSVTVAKSLKEDVTDPTRVQPTIECADFCVVENKGIHWVQSIIATRCRCNNTLQSSTTQL